MDESKLKALSAIENERFELARQLLGPIAENGDAEAQCELGTLYQLGLGGERDITEAIYWLEKAAASGSGLAAYNLGTLYLTCTPDLPVDKEKSENWRAIARKLGYAPFNT